MKKLFFLGLLLCASATQAQTKEKVVKKPAATVVKTEVVSENREEDKKAVRKEKREARKEARDKAVKGRRYYIDANGTKTYLDEA